MKTRIISGIVMAPLLILVILGGNFLTAAAFLIAVLGLREFFNGFRMIDIRPSYPIALASTVLLYIFHYIIYFSSNEVRAAQISAPLYMGWLIITAIMCMLMLFRIKNVKLEDAMATFIGIIYVSFFSYHIALTEMKFADVCKGSPVWFIVITAFCTDIAAYFGGTYLGKNKLCPIISPKKTIEGSVCGIAGSLFISFLFGLIFGDHTYLLSFIVIGILGGIVSQVGDLTASVFKRNMGIKDYSNMIPGHGGIMDRFDSVLFTAPLVYYCFYLLIR